MRKNVLFYSDRIPHGNRPSKSQVPEGAYDYTVVTRVYAHGDLEKLLQDDRVHYEAADFVALDDSDWIHTGDPENIFPDEVSVFYLGEDGKVGQTTANLYLWTHIDCVWTRSRASAEAGKVQIRMVHRSGLLVDPNDEKSNEYAKQLCIKKSIDF